MTKTLDSSSWTAGLVSAASVFTLFTILLAVGCGQLPGTSSVAASSTSGSSDEEIAMIIEDRAITISDLNEHMKDQFLEEFLRQPADRQFELRQTAARDLVQTHIIETEANNQKITSEQLVEKIGNEVADPTEQEIATWFAQNQARLRGARLEDVSSQIGQHLGNERRSEAMNDFLGPKLDALSWQMVLSPPRVAFTATRLVRGPSEAPVTIMTFSDYQCPYCIRAEPVLAEVLQRYPTDVRVVHRHFPLESIHPFARPAAEASMCADEQGKFWEYHDAIYALAGKIQADSLAQIGESLGLDLESLGSCIEARRYKDFVDADFAAGREAGVTGTPAFFVNGISLKGARDADELSRYVDQELERIAQN